MKTYLVTMTKRLTETQVVEMERYAQESNDTGLPEWFSDLVDEAVFMEVSDKSWPEGMRDDPDLAAKFFTNVQIKEE